MNVFMRYLLVFLACFSFSSVSAKTITYELFGLNSSNAEINYPRLDFYNATSAKLTVEKNEFMPAAELASLEIVFPRAATLKASGFKKIGPDIYRASLTGAWVFKDLMVEIRVPKWAHDMPVDINVKVIELASLINPDVESLGSQLLFAQGMLRDITPVKVADTASVVVDSKQLNLSLKDRIGFKQMSFESGFVIDAAWLGHGQKTLYIPAPVAGQESDLIEAVALILEEIPIPDGIDYMVRVKFMSRGNGDTSSSVPLRELLERAYGGQ